MPCIHLHPAADGRDAAQTSGQRFWPTDSYSLSIGSAVASISFTYKGDPRLRLELTKREGSALRTRQEALPPEPPAKGEALCNLSIGVVSEEGQPRPRKVGVGPRQ
jgi:hypothetical protein